MEQKTLSKEIEEIIVFNASFFEDGTISNGKELTDKILALEPFATVERVRELAKMYSKANQGIHDCSCTGDMIRSEQVRMGKQFLSLLNQPEEFDVREWMEEQCKEDARFRDFDTHIRYYPSNPLYKIKFYFSGEKLTIKSCYTDAHDETLYRGTSKFSKSFFLQLLDALGVEV